MELLRDEFIVELLSIVHKCMLPYYEYYTSSTKNMMNFDSFCKFCLDFGIFPDILAKAKIMKLFT